MIWNLVSFSFFNVLFDYVSKFRLTKEQLCILLKHVSVSIMVSGAPP